ncbi:MAG: cyclase family protein [Pleomorphochaeta sp.]
MKLSQINELSKLINNSKFIDLSYTLEEGMPTWPTQARYSSTIYESYDYGDESLHSRITLSEHTGTHIDAPKHFYKEGCSIDELNVNTIFSRGVKISAKFIEPKSLFTLKDLDRFEQENGEISESDIVMFQFGWDSKYGTYSNSKEYMKDWPGISEEVAVALKEKKIAAVGCDTLCIDVYNSPTNPAHKVLLGNKIPIIENIKNLDLISVYSYVIGLPNKFKNGSGSPIRLISLN